MTGPGNYCDEVSSTIGVRSLMGSIFHLGTPIPITGDGGAQKLGRGPGSGYERRYQAPVSGTRTPIPR